MCSYNPKLATSPAAACAMASGSEPPPPRLTIQAADALDAINQLQAHAKTFPEIAEVIGINIAVQDGDDDVNTMTISGGLLKSSLASLQATIKSVLENEEDHEFNMSLVNKLVSCMVSSSSLPLTPRDP